jgi:hypothetical protein
LASTFLQRARGLSRSLALIVLAISAVILSPGTASAYNLEGQTWANQAGPGTCCANVFYHLPLVWSNANVDENGSLNAASAWNASPALSDKRRHLLEEWLRPLAGRWVLIDDLQRLRLALRTAEPTVEEKRLLAVSIAGDFPHSGFEAL